ncbi:nose resistant to fluoxetine protein 6-like [Centruroides vittatus]|uniref:nose resistant to fluoxetine protein 6-like n=1 Tax=Centruroides vittatus TaxID=120091 RepID=UPI00350F3E35
MKKRIVLFVLFVFIIFCKSNEVLEKESGYITEKMDSSELDKTVKFLNAAEKNLRNLAKSVVKFALPYLMKLSEKTNLTSSCVKSGVMFMRDLTQLKKWPLQMLDSMGKPSAGMLGLTSWIRGDYDQCLNIDSGHSSKLRNSKNINGMYCAIKFEVPKIKPETAELILNFRKNTLLHLLENLVKPLTVLNSLKQLSFLQVDLRFDICIPSDCHEDDLKNILNWLLDSKLSARVDYCKEKNQKVVYSTAQVICLSIFGFLSSWVVLATFVETLMELSIISSSGKRDTPTRNLIFVSLYQSIRKLRYHCIEERTAAFCGIKFILMCILIYLHILYTLANETVEKQKNIYELFEYIHVEISTAAMAMMEIFFFIRFTVPVSCLLAATIILPLLGDGPHWNDLLSDVHEIVENWPKHVFYYINFIEYNDGNSIRLQHLWFISALFQQILVAVPLLFINNRWPKYGKIITVMLIVAGVVSHIINTIVYKDHTMFGYSFLYTKIVNYMNHNYFKPYYAHLNSFFTGFLFGCFLSKKKEIKFGYKTLLVFWVGSIILLMLAIFGLHGYKIETSPNDTIVYLHHTLSPFAFTVATAWISIACITGYGGICNRIFSLRIFCMLDKLIIWIYMLHVLVIMYIYGHLRKGVYASALTLVMDVVPNGDVHNIDSVITHAFICGNTIKLSY